MSIPDTNKIAQQGIVGHFLCLNERWVDMLYVTRQP